MCVHVCLYLIFFYIYFGMTPNLLTLSVPNRNFATLLRRCKRCEISNLSEYSLSACQLILTKYALPPPPPRTLRSGLSSLGSGGRSFEEGSHLCFMLKK